MDATTYHRLGTGLSIATALLLVFGLGALGIVGDGGPEDRGYLAVFAVLLVGVAASRLRAPGLAVALGATAVTTVVVAVVSLALGLHHGDGGSAADVLMVSGLYAGLFGLAGWLFRRASGRGAARPAGLAAPRR